MSDARELVLVGNFLPDRQESMLRFNDLLQTGLQSRGWNVSTWRPEPRFAKLAGPYRYDGLPKYLGYLDKFIVFPRTIRRRLRQSRRRTAYHIVDHSNAVYVSHLKGEHSLVTCHDLLQIRSARGDFPQNAVSGTGKRYQEWILDRLRRAPRVVCISGKTRSDLRRLTDLSEEATPVIYMGLNYPYRPMEKSEAERVLRSCVERQGVSWNDLAGESAGFLLGIGGAHWYKNRTGLVSIFAALQKHPGTPKRLVYIGPAFDDEQQRILSASQLERAVVRIVGLSNEELRAAYSLSRGLLFPSWEEGFGWPIAEAQACGCPVFTSNREPMIEIGGDAACYLDPSDAGASALIMSKTLPDTSAMVARGLRRAAQWDTNRMLDEYEREYASSGPLSVVATALAK